MKNIQEIKIKLIESRNKIMDSFFYFLSRKMKKQVKEINRQIDAIEALEDKTKSVEFEAQVKRSDASSRRLAALLRSLS